MKTLPIYICDSKKLEDNENMGFDKNGDCYQLVDLHFDERKLSGFWIDPGIDEDIGEYCINFYVAGDSFKTPFTTKTELKLLNYLNT